MRAFTIPPGMPFPDALAAGIRHRWPDAAPAARVLVPDAAVGVVLARRLTALGLPDIAVHAIGDPDDLTTWPVAAGDAPALLPPMRRRLLLARLVWQWSRRDADAEPMGMGQAVHLADSLMRLIDELQRARLGLSALSEFVPDRFAAHRRVTLDFLAVLCEHWPHILAAEGGAEPVARHNRMLDGLAAAWRAAPPAGPVIAAGFAETGDALAELLSVVGALPRGAVVFAGLDRDLDEAAWVALGPTHPQYALRDLLSRMDVARAGVADWPADAVPAAPPGRVRLIAEAMRPADTTEAWADALRHLAPHAETAFANLTRIEARDPREAAAAIALMLRAGSAEPDRTAALVTPDRALARRVTAELRRWGLRPARPGGMPAADTPDALFLRLLARAAAADFAPVPLLAVLKHPLAGGADRDAFAGRVRRLDLALRGPRPAPGLSGIVARLIDAGAEEGFVAWFDALADRLRPFADLVAAGGDLEPLAAAHRDAASALAGDAHIEAAAALLDAIAGAAPGFGRVEAGAYADLFEALVATAPPVFSGDDADARLAIWDLDQARLRHAELTVLAGLDEGVWPEAARADPWLNRPLRLELGLPVPEATIGRAAAAFVQAACAPRAAMVRARKAEGAPTVPSRWLVRLGILAQGLGFADRPDAPAALLAEVDAADAPSAFAPIRAPRPTPPAASRPALLSAGEVEMLLRDPYAVYARRVLRLRPLERLDADPGAAERGQIVHAALERFVRANPDRLPSDALDRLIEEGRRLFDQPGAAPVVAAFWRPRFARMARWFVEAFEAEARAHGAPVALAALGVRKIDERIALTAKVDRIDRRSDGTLALYDYTTGRAPSADQGKAAYSPRLLLAGLVAEAGGFPGVPTAAVGALVHVVLRGGDPPGVMQPVEGVGIHLRRAEAGLKRLLARFADPATPYTAAGSGGWPGPYDHLARHGEWDLAGDGGD